MPHRATDLLGTSMLPIRLSPCILSSAPLSAKSPTNVSARHLMKSSSMPPAVVTKQSTMRFWTKYLRRGAGSVTTPAGGFGEGHLMCSRVPAETKLEVYPKNMRVRVLARNSGSTWSGSVWAVTGSSLNRQFICSGACFPF